MQRILALAATMALALPFAARQAAAAPILLLAGGGGGGAGRYAGGGDGQAGLIAQDGQGNGGAAGTSGAGGQGGSYSGGGGGAGALGGGGDGAVNGSGGLAYPNFAPTSAFGGGYGGYGGGGGGGSFAGGGGGGYDGGGGGSGIDGGGGGGGSYFASSFSNTGGTGGANGGDGVITLTNGNIAMTFDYAGTPQRYIVPITSSYLITAAGAQGGTYQGSTSAGGLGAFVGGDIFLSAGEILDIEVGGMGGINNNINGQGGGGGGSFVYDLVQAAPVPEPASPALLGAGLLAVGLIRWRRRT